MYKEVFIAYSLLKSSLVLEDNKKELILAYNNMCKTLINAMSYLDIVLKPINPNATDETIKKQLLLLESFLQELENNSLLD